MDWYWIMLYGITAVCGLIGTALWFLLPRKWIVWPELVLDGVRDSIPPWSSLNAFGRILLVTFYSSAVIMLLLLIGGTLVENLF